MNQSCGCFLHTPKNPASQSPSHWKRKNGWAKQRFGSNLILNTTSMKHPFSKCLLMFFMIHATIEFTIPGSSKCAEFVFYQRKRQKLDIFWNAGRSRYIDAIINPSRSRWSSKPFSSNCVMPWHSLRIQSKGPAASPQEVIQRSVESFWRQQKRRFKHEFDRIFCEISRIKFYLAIFNENMQ